MCVCGRGGGGEGKKGGEEGGMGQGSLNYDFGEIVISYISTFILSSFPGCSYHWVVFG